MKLEVGSPRWDHNDIYTIKKTKNGWYVRGVMSIEGECDKTGAPYLFDNLRQDIISYPYNLGWYMEQLWDYSSSENMSESEIQEQLDLIGKWIRTTQEAAPGGIFL